MTNTTDNSANVLSERKGLPITKPLSLSQEGHITPILHEVFGVHLGRHKNQDVKNNLEQPTDAAKPPSSPTKRRKLLKESEDNAGELSIKHYTYRTNPYRSTSVDFPFPTPLFLGPENTTAQFGHHESTQPIQGLSPFGLLPCVVSRSETVLS